MTAVTAVTDWLVERLHPQVQVSYKIARELYRKDTGCQTLQLIEVADLGRILALDRIVQLCTSDEFIYHEMLTHVPLLSHGMVRDVLVIGGGDGGCLRELVRHSSLQRITLVEIDAEVIAFARRWLPTVCAGGFDDPRVRIVIADGADFIARTSQRYDLILVDSTDPIGPGAVLFHHQFYARCQGVLRPGGILVAQSGVPFYQGAEFMRTQSRLAQVFRHVGFYLIAVPTYIGGMMALAWASDDRRSQAPSIGDLQRRCLSAGITGLRYYTPEVHQAAFAVPPFIADLSQRGTSLREAP